MQEINDSCKRARVLTAFIAGVAFGLGTLAGATLFVNAVAISIRLQTARKKALYGDTFPNFPYAEAKAKKVDK